jgi:phosphate uptake regulator
MISRVFRSVLRDPTAASQIGLPRETCFDYQSSARQLERIADHASKIARLSIEVDDVSAEIADGLCELREEALAVPEAAMNALLEDDAEEATRLATEARSRIRPIDDSARDIDDRIHQLDSQTAQVLGLVVDSLSRTADYGGNIAESALQKAAPRP